jgi:Fe-S oxidoreductase
LDEGFLDYDEGVADIMYTTLNDRMIQHWCVGNYDHEELVIDARARIFEKGLAPEDVIAYSKNLRTKPVQGGNPAKILTDAGVTLDSDSDTLLFCGSAARGSQQATLIASGKLFNQAGQSFKVLADEPSSGWALYQLGDFEGAKQISELLAEKIRQSKVSTVVALDADSYRMLMGRTTRFGGDIKGIKILHVNAVMAGWLKDKEISVAQKIPDAATYHDPCVLARFFEDIDSPRYILTQILAEELKEMATNKKLANCCGAGGMLAVHRPDVSEDVAGMRIDEAIESGAARLISGCPRCDETFKNAMAARGIKDIQVVNLVELVAQAAGIA